VLFPADAATLTSHGEFYVDEWVHTVQFSRDGNKIVVGSTEDIIILDAGNFLRPLCKANRDSDAHVVEWQRPSMWLPTNAKLMVIGSRPSFL
jgi:hypothetical protein